MPIGFGFCKPSRPVITGYIRSLQRTAKVLCLPQTFAASLLLWMDKRNYETWREACINIVAFIPGFMKVGLRVHELLQTLKSVCRERLYTL